MIHRIPWKCGNSYGEIAQSYADFTIRHYGLNATVVFDGYGEGPTIKDNTHQRRGQNIHPIVNFTAETKFDGKKDEFLSRDINKQRLINLISAEIEQKGCTVVNAAGDVDVDIVRSAVDASLLYSTTLIGEDTDLLVLLLYYAQENGKGLYFNSDKTKKDGSQKVYDIRSLKKVMGPEICTQLLFIHTLTGCDTTSRIFSVGKKSVFQKLMKGDPVVKSCANAFTVPHQTTEVMDELECQVMAVIFGGKCTDSLAALRCKILSKKVLHSSSFVCLQLNLPPNFTAEERTIKSWFG